MSSIFKPIIERRYADYPRRYLCEYHVFATNSIMRPDSKGRCATLVSARHHAMNAIDDGFCAVVRIFDSKIGQYLFTYKASKSGIIKHEGCVK